MSDSNLTMTPAERMTAGLCPECGKDLAGLNPEAERDYHWAKKPKNDGSSNEALARYTMLTGFAADLEKKAAKKRAKDTGDDATA